jgi:hypothetical protein
VETVVLNDTCQALVTLVQTQVVVPYDNQILATLMPASVRVDQIASAAEQLVATNVLRVVVIGRQRHLAVVADQPHELTSGVSNRNSSVSSAENHTKMEHDSKLEIATDAETERLMLYRVALVFLVVIALLLLRQIGLALM